MISILGRIKLARLGGLATLGVVAVGLLTATPALAWDLAPHASAQSDAVKSALDELESPDHELSPLEQFLGVLGVLDAQIVDLQKSLISLKGLNSDQTSQRGEYLLFLEESASYLTALRLDTEVEVADIKFLADDLRTWKEEIFDPQVQEILNFSLILQARSILRTAESRYLKIRSDIERLSDLKILTDNRANLLLTEARLLLTAADTLLNQAEELLEEGGQDAQLRKAVNAAIVKIKLAYRKFLDISYLVRSSIK
ncbi:MAG: hypothetical protein AAB345_03115 [Patescibacteria group bacterium]